MVLVGSPLIFLGKAKILWGTPMFFVGEPMIYRGEPMFFIGKPILRFKGTSLSKGLGYDL